MAQGKLPNPETVPLTSLDGPIDFECESAELTRFLRENASQNERRGSSRSWVLCRSEGQENLPPILGFYTLALLSVEREHLPKDINKRLPPYPVPGYLIGRLARDIRAKGHLRDGLTIGQRLLDDAHLRALHASEHVAGVVVVVDPKDERATGFYGKFGYRPMELSEGAGKPPRMFLPLKTVRAAYED